MKEITFTHLRHHAEESFDLVESGESVRVFRDGKPVADIVPVSARLPSWKRRPVQPLVLEGIAASRILLEERETGL